MRRAIEEIQDYGIEVDIWKIEGVDERLRLRDARAAVAQGRGPRGRGLRGARPRRLRRQGRPVAARGRAGRGLHRLRDRPLDLVGRAQGLPRRLALARGRRAADRRQLPSLRARVQRGRERGRAALPSADNQAWQLRIAAMRMRQSLAQFEAAFREETAEERERHERLRAEAVRRSYAAPPAARGAPLHGPLRRCSCWRSSERRCWSRS